jgi:hypothetical protein
MVILAQATPCRDCPGENKEIPQIGQQEVHSGDHQADREDAVAVLLHHAISCLRPGSGRIPMYVTSLLGTSRS